MIRRVHVERLKIGSIALDPTEAHHMRDVLRLTVGTPLELFDDGGAVAIGKVTHMNSANVVVLVAEITTAESSTVSLTVASAVPKGDRADWMVEKLTELGVARFMPLIAERSVVLPAGKNKIERWERIAIESAKQSRRSGVMTIAPLATLDEVIGACTPGWYLSTAADAMPASQAEIALRQLLLVGPEGGWAPAEINRMQAAGLQSVALTSTVLRVETAAVTGAGVILCLGRKFTEARSIPSNDSALP